MTITLLTFEELENTPAIYSICNVKTKRIYIGSTISAERRFKEHKNLLTNNKHSNKFLQNDFNKSEENFVFAILEIVQDSNTLILREQAWLDKHYDSQTSCYNFCPVAGNHLGTKHSERTKLKQSLASKGKAKTAEHAALIKRIKQKNKGKKVYQYSIEGQLFNSFPSISEASTKTLIAKSSIINVLKGKRLNAGGFLWSEKEYHGEELTKQYQVSKKTEASRKALQIRKINFLKKYP